MDGKSPPMMQLKRTRTGFVVAPPASMAPPLMANLCGHERLRPLH